MHSEKRALQCDALAIARQEFVLETYSGHGKLSTEAMPFLQLTAGSSKRVRGAGALVARARQGLVTGTSGKELDDAIYAVATGISVAS